MRNGLISERHGVARSAGVGHRGGGRRDSRRALRAARPRPRAARPWPRAISAGVAGRGGRAGEPDRASLGARAVAGNVRRPRRAAVSGEQVRREFGGRASRRRTPAPTPAVPGIGRVALATSAMFTSCRRAMRTTSLPISDQVEPVLSYGRMDRLSGLDASFLYFETPAHLMHVCGLLVLDPSTMPGEYTLRRAARQAARAARDHTRRSAASCTTRCSTSTIRCGSTTTSSTSSTTCAAPPSRRPAASASWPRCAPTSRPSRSIAPVRCGRCG